MRDYLAPRVEPDNSELPFEDTISQGARNALTFSPAHFIAIFRRRQNVFYLGFVCASVLGILITMLTAPVFRATAYLLVAPPTLKLNQVDPTNPLSELFSGVQDYNLDTQVKLLQGRSLVQSAKKRLNARTMPDISAKVIQGTNIIQVDAEARDPLLAANTANTLLDVYIEEVADANGQALRKAIKLTQDGTNNALAELKRTERQLVTFKERYKIADATQEMTARTGVAQQLKDRVVQATSRLSAIQAQLAFTRQQLQQEPATITVPGAMNSDASVENMETQLSNLQAQRGSLLERYTPTNSKVVGVDIQIAETKRRLEQLRQNAQERRITNPAYTTLRAKVLDYEDQENGIVAELARARQAYADAEDKLNRFPVRAMELDRIQRQRELSLQAYSAFASKLGDLQLRLQTRQVNARVMEPAVVPSAPDRPNRPLNVLFSLLIGLVLGVAFALVQEYVDDRINNPEDIGQNLGVPHLVAVPAVQPEELRPTVSAAMSSVVNRYSPVVEAFRTLRTGIRFAATGSELFSISVTSSMPSEGKSTVSYNLAKTLGLDNKRVILVDADLRRPSLHRVLGIKRDKGLSDILAGACTIEEALRPTPAENVRFISAGSAAPNPAELLGSASMNQFLESIRLIADVVVVDTSPVLAVTDASIVTAKTDGVLFVVAVGEATWGRVRKSLEILSRSRARILGVLTNKLDTSTMTADSGYYGYEYAPLEEESDGGSETTGSDTGTGLLESDTRDQRDAGGRTKVGGRSK